MLAGPPKSEAAIVANPSPSNVLFKPGSSIKFSPTTCPLVVISPICSINTASTTGAIIIIAPISNFGKVNDGTDSTAALAISAV